MQKKLCSISITLNINANKVDRMQTMIYRKNGTVILTGHTDAIGEVNYNKTLSLARANNVKTILEKSLASAGRTDVKFEIHAVGEDIKLAPFENKFPEERFYNRTVVIDIIK